MHRSLFRTMRRAAAGALAASLLFCATAQAEKLALILAISNYSRQPLPGVTKDVENASEIAKLMGVPEANITVKRDDELAGGGLLKAIDEFAARVRSEDQVFVYYSGHGSSYTKPGAKGLCEKALVAQDISFVPKEEVQRRLTALSNRPGKTFVFLDSCFSGGLVQLKGARAFGAAGGMEVHAKFTAASPTDPCSVAANVKGARDFDIAAAEKVPNYYLLGAAAENEVAIDGGKAMGGFASSSLLDCLRSPEKADKNGDGIVTLDEAKACAQEKVNALLAQGQAASASFPYSSMTLTSGSGQGGNAPLLFTAPRQGTVNTPAFAQTLFEGRDARRNVTITASANPVRIGQDVQLTVTSDKAGYLTLMVVGSSGKIYKIFPNDMDQDARIGADAALPVPRPGMWRMPASAPVGDNWFLALVSDTPDRFKDLGKPAGIFRAFGDDAAGAKGLFDWLFRPAKRPDAPAPDSPGAGASTTYGAALIKVAEVE